MAEEPPPLRSKQAESALRVAFCQLLFTCLSVSWAVAKHFNHDRWPARRWSCGLELSQHLKLQAALQPQGDWEHQMHYDLAAGPRGPQQRDMYNLPSEDGRALRYPVRILNIHPLLLEQRNCFTVDASQAGRGAVDLAIGPLGSNLPHSIRDLGNQRYEVSFIPHDCQDHFIGIQFNGISIAGSPFVIPAPEVDLSGVVVTGEGHRTAKIGVPAHFSVDCSSTRATLPLNVSIAGPSGQHVPAQVVDIRHRAFNVEWTAVCGGDHTINITYGTKHIPGCPFKVKVTNPQAVVVVSPSTALKGRPVEYQVKVGDAGPGALECSVLYNGTAVANSVQPSGPETYTLSFIPIANGPHRVDIRLDGQHVPGSPFIANVTGGAQYVNIVEHSKFHQVGHPVSIKIEATHAGEGQLVVEVRSPSNGIENELRPVGSKTYELSFVPAEAGVHSIIVLFNDQQVPQSPYKFMVQPTTVPNGVQPSSAAMFSTDRHGFSIGHNQMTTSKRLVQSHVTHRLPPGTAITPVHEATHNGFAPGELIDAAQRLQQPPVTKVAAVPVAPAFMSKPWEQQTLMSRTVHKEDLSYQTLPSVTMNGSSTSSADLAHSEAYHGQSWGDNPRRPQPSARSAQEQSRIITYTPQQGAVVANEPCYFELNSNGLPISQLDIRITDPVNSSVPFEVVNLNGRQRVTFIPKRLGTYMVNIIVDSVPMPASPYAYFVQHQGGVKLYNVTEKAYVGRDIDFTVDHSVIDSDNLTVEVSLLGRRLPTRQQAIGHRITRYVFTPEAAGDHCIDVAVNYVAVAGSPFKISVEEHSQAASDYRHSDTMYSDTPAVVADVGRGLASFAVFEKNHFLLEMRGRHWSLPDMHVDVRAPNGELIAASLIPQASNEIKVEYQSPYVGRHSVDIFYKGRKLPGCPYYVEVFDPTKVSVQHVTSESVVQEQTEFEVVSEEAGRADMECRVISPSGLLIPCRVFNTPRGMTVKYTPVEPGTYCVHTFIGGVEIPGSPMTQIVYETRATLLRQRQAFESDESMPALDSTTIQTRRTRHTAETFDEPDASMEARASASMQRSRYHERHESSSDTQGSRSKSTDGGLGLLTVYGPGLCRGEADSKATFFIDTHGMQGTPVVHIEGPNSMAKVHIDPHGSSTFKVTYLPVDVGYYAICIKWLNKEIDGSPFRAIVVDPRKVQVHGGWHNTVDSQGHLPLIVNEVKRIHFSIVGAGPGKLRAEVKHTTTGRLLSVSIDEKSEHDYYVTFVPDEIGDYTINVFWSDLPILHSPLRGLAISGMVPVDHTKVILTGKGLREAYAGQRCEFIIDGSQAGHGFPHVVLRSSEVNEMQIPCEALGFNRYRCMYTAPAVGEYLLYVSWSDRELRDSPFRVMVTQSSASEASRVTFNGSLPTTGIVNQSLTTMIDTQFAGPGELVSRCVGPSKIAVCELADQGDGLYLLSVKPREIGQHILEVTYAGQHITGSPHAFLVSSPADPSKVQVVGPGVEDGVLSTFQSHFFVHTQGAGAGSLSVRVRGPKGGFNVAMRRATAEERTVECTFSPTEVGLYIVTVRWSDVDVPGSPFYVHIFETAQELERFMHYGTLPGDGERREYTYLSAMSASEPMLNTLNSSDQQYRSTGHHSHHTSWKTRHYTSGR